MKSSTDILLVVSEFPPGPGGIGQHGYCLAKAMAQGGARVRVLANTDFVTKAEAAEFDSALPDGLEVHRNFKGGCRAYLKRFRNLLGLLRTHRFDAVFLSGKFPLWCTVIIKMVRPRLPILSILHGTEVNLANPLLRRFTHFCIGRATVLVPVSRFTRSLLPEKIRNTRRIEVIPNGLDPDEWTEDHGATKLDGNPALLTVGNVTRRKGQHRVIQAMPSILEAYPEARYHMVGLPTEETAFRELADGLGIGDKVVFHGRLKTRSELIRTYRAADAFLILSENQASGDVEGFGIVVLEASALGLPSIGARGCGIEDAIEDGLNGYLVNGDDPSEVREAVTRILTNREHLVEGCAEWSKRHEWQPLAQTYLGLVSRTS